MEVHNQLGDGFLERVYQEALAVELALREIPFAREAALPVLYKGSPLTCSYIADFICYDEIIVETKALGKLTSIEESQVINYLKATGLHRALLLNFGVPHLEHKRYVREYLRSSASSVRSPGYVSGDRVREVLD